MNTSDVPPSERGANTPDTIRLRSFIVSKQKWVNISLSGKTCDCDEFLVKGRCEHLSAVGIYRLKPFMPSTHPTYSQALSGLVKSLRVRKVEEAVYWLVYLDNFEGSNFRFRTARRLLIGAAEDGHSICVMEQVAEKFRQISKPGATLSDFVAEAVRICKLPNWWHPDSGGPTYIYQSLVGQRTWLYKTWDRTADTLQQEIERAINTHDAVTAIGGVMAFTDVRPTFGSTKQAEFLLKLAQDRQHALAQRLVSIHLSAKTALSGDNNFLCQAAWMMAGGVSPLAEGHLPVTAGECDQLIARAKERWKYPQPIPRWCLDGVHSAGDDSRFIGCLPQMWAVCAAFQHYGRVEPSDDWLPQFQCYDGLIIEQSNPRRERLHTVKVVYFLKSTDGQYLQAQLNVSNGEWRFWLQPTHASASCHGSIASAEQYRAMAEPLVGPLVIVQEVL